MGGNFFLYFRCANKGTDGILKILKTCDKTIDAKVMVHCHEFRAFCWSEYSVVWTLTPVDRGILEPPTGTTALSSMQTIIVWFQFSTTNCFRYWY